ncbi:hypothetical protein C0992_003203 [Termitomyces sp. T32_za158]|nr:hypothetical protein C0992_003203 [Termitomyces sp. T32_za158]
MKRPVTPENKPDIYEVRTALHLTTKPILVMVENTRPRDEILDVDLTKPQELPAGSQVIVFDAKALSLTRGAIVAIRESTTFNGEVYPKGELFAINSNPKTPMGQIFSFKHPIANALYDVVHVKKEVFECKVRNSSMSLVPHKDLQRITQ